MSISAGGSPNEKRRSPDLVERSAKAVFWGYLGGIAKLTVQVAAQALLARILGPSVFGIFALGIIIVSISNFVAEGGIGALIVREEVLDDELVEFVFWWQQLMAVGTALLIFFLSPAIASIFSKPESARVLQWLSLVCVASSLGSASLNILKRDLEYRFIQFAQALSYFLGYAIVGVPLAIAGAGIWSLVVAWIVQAFMASALLYWRCRHGLTPRLRHKNAAAYAKYAAGALTSNISTWATGSIDKLIVGYEFSAGLLANYTVPNSLLSTPAVQLLSTLQGVLFSATSRRVSDLNSLRTSYLAMIEGVSLFICPAYLTVFVFPDVFLLGLYGSKWAGAVEVTRPVAISVLFYSFSAVCTPFLWSLGRIRNDAYIHLSALLATTGCIWFVSSKFGVAEVAWTIVGITAVKAFLVIATTNTALLAKSLDILRAGTPGFVLSLIVIVSLKIFMAAASDWTSSSEGRLSMFVVCAAIVYAAGFRYIAYRMLSGIMRERISGAICSIRSRARRFSPGS